MYRAPNELKPVMQNIPMAKKIQDEEEIDDINIRFSLLRMVGDEEIEEQALQDSTQKSLRSNQSEFTKSFKNRASKNSNVTRMTVADSDTRFTKLSR